MEFDKTALKGELLEVGNWHYWYPRFQILIMRMKGIYEYIESDELPSFLTPPALDVPTGKVDEEGNIEYKDNPRYYGRGGKDVWSMEFRKHQNFIDDFEKNRIAVGQMLLSMLSPTLKSRLKKRFSMSKDVAEEMAQKEEFQNHQYMEPNAHVYSLE